jgi:hypothetical protein
MVGTFIVGLTDSNEVDCKVLDDMVRVEGNVTEDKGEMQGVRL